MASKSGSLLTAQLGLDKAIEVPVHDGLDIPCFMARTEILDHLIGLEDVGADLAAESDFALLAVGSVRL